MSEGIAEIIDVAMRPGECGMVVSPVTYLEIEGKRQWSLYLMCGPDNLVHLKFYEDRALAFETRADILLELSRRRGFITVDTDDDLVAALYAKLLWPCERYRDLYDETVAERERVIH